MLQRFSWCEANREADLAERNSALGLHAKVQLSLTSDLFSALERCLESVENFWLAQMPCMSEINNFLVESG